VALRGGSTGTSATFSGTSPVIEPSGLPWPADATRLQVADLQVDLRYRQLLGPEKTVELPQRVFELLLVFLAEPQVLHARASLFDRVWPGVVVEDANLSQSIWMLRKALGPERRGWIRTVAKSGYVFQPPGPVTLVAAEPAGTASMAANVAEPVVNAQEDDTIVPAGAPTPGPAPAALPASARRRMGWRTGLAALAVGLVLATALALVAPRLASSSSVAEPVAIALVEVGEPVDPAAGWPASLLHAWLEFKLKSLPDVVVMTEAHLAADATRLSPAVVLLSSGTSAGRPGEHFVRARFDDRGGPRQIELRGSAAQMPGLVDRLSAQVMDALLPDRRGEPWPTLDIDATTATAYARAYDAYARRDLAASAEGLADVVERAPGFGMAQLQLATTLARLGQARPAMAHMQAARGRLVPLPADARRVLDAAALAIDPQRYVEAAAAFDALATEYPGKNAFRLDQAWYQFRSGDPESALQTLSVVDWQAQPVTVRIRWRLIRAEIAFSQGDGQGVRDHAGHAVALARAGGDGWKRELATALHLQALVDVAQHGDQADPGGFRQAAALFQQIGADLDALYVKVSAELSRAPNGDTRNFDTLLARARAGGYRSLEITLLRRAAFQHYAVGDLATYRTRLEQARAVAETSGDAVGQQGLDMDLLNEDLLIGRFDLARERLRRLRSGRLSGDQAAWLDQYEAFILGVEGDFGGAVNALAQTPARLAREDLPALPATTDARLACSRGELLLVQGQLQEARAALDRCGSIDEPFYQHQAQLLGANADLLAGDDAGVRNRLRDLDRHLQALPDSPERWNLALQLAYLLDRNGQHERAAQLYHDTRTSLAGTGYRWLMANVALGLAETRAAQGDWRRASARAREARQWLPPGTWGQRQRLDAVEILLQLAAGEHESATARLTASHAEAHRLGDVPAQIALHGLMSSAARVGPCDAAARSAQVAGSGMRGANLDWLTAALPRDDRRTALD
jgi:DNA-binding winged helix-turn-helix (wHTH) protein